MGNNNSSHQERNRKDLKFAKESVSFGTYDKFSKSGKQLLLQALDQGKPAQPKMINRRESISQSCTNINGLQPNGKQMNGSNEDGSHLIKGSKSFRRLSITEQLEVLRSRPGNRVCADCDALASTWASITFGVFLCLKCVGCHRSLGSHISFTQSTSLDTHSWTEEALERLDQVGNQASNGELEYHVPYSYPKPATGVTTMQERSRYIDAKYKQKLFAKSNQSPSTPPLRPRFDNVVNSTESNHKANEAFVGMVEITLHRGKNLAARDALRNTSDPYVVFELGSRRGKSSYKRNKTDPIWNENPSNNLSLRIPWDGEDLLKISCWDHESITSDNLIGRAIVDLSALPTTKTAHTIVFLYGGKESKGPRRLIHQTIKGIKNHVRSKSVDFPVEKKMLHSTGELSLSFNLIDLS